MSTVPTKEPSLGERIRETRERLYRLYGVVPETSARK